MSAAPTVTRNLSIVYGLTTVGGTSPYQLTGIYRQTRRYGLTTVVFLAKVDGEATAANFKASCDALELAFTTPRQNLTVTMESQSLLALSHSANTGFNARPSIEKLERGASGRSRVYQVRIEFDTPADLTGQNGLRDSTVALSVDRYGVRRVAIEGTYTALGANTARVQHDAQVSAYCETQLDAIDAAQAWKLLTRPTETSDDPDKFLDFQRIYVDRLVFIEAHSTLPSGHLTAVVSGSYQTAGSGARAVYTASAATDSAAALARISGSFPWELVGETADADEADTFLTFRRTYEQVRYQQSTAGGDHTSIKKQRIRVTRGKSAPGDYDSSARRLTALRVSYTAWVDLDVTTDLRGLWEGTIRPLLAEYVAAVSDSQTLALVESEPLFHPDLGQISVTQTWLSSAGSSLLSSSLLVRDIRSAPKNYMEVWSGNPWDVDEVPSFQRHIRVIRYQRSQLAGGTLGERPRKELTHIRNQDRVDGFAVIDEDVSAGTAEVGISGNQFTIRREDYTQVLRKVNVVGTGGGGGTFSSVSPGGGLVVGGGGGDSAGRPSLP